jgi:TRIAP1/MDM35 family protein
MSSISQECDLFKQNYDKCFNKWYTDSYLKGETNDTCADLFKVYKKCVWKVINEKKIDSLIDVVVKDHSIPSCSE